MANPISPMSLRDNDQIVKYEHDDDLCAKRVIIVGGDFKMDIDPSQITDAIKEGLKDIKLEAQPSVQSSESIRIEKIDVPFPIIEKDIQVIHVKETVPVITTEIKIVEIEKPIIQEKVVTVEKPIFIIQPKIEQIQVPTIVEKVIEKVPSYMYALLAFQTAIIIFAFLK